MVARWVENPYYQHLCGETFFQHGFPLDPSSLTRWRKRIGEEGVEWLLTKTIKAGRASGVISERSAEAVIVDTTAMEKAIAHPTDARLYEKARRRLVVLAQEAGPSLRQSYARLAPRLSGQAGRYAHARQFKRMRKVLRRLKGYTLRRDLRRRSAIEPAIGHMKTDGRLARCALKGTLGDALHAVLCGSGHNIRMILAHLRAFVTVILAALLAAHGAKAGIDRSECGLKVLAA